MDFALAVIIAVLAFINTLKPVVSNTDTFQKRLFEKELFRTAQIMNKQFFQIFPEFTITALICAIYMLASLILGLILLTLTIQGSGDILFTFTFLSALYLFPSSLYNLTELVDIKSKLNDVYKDEEDSN